MIKINNVVSLYSALYNVAKYTRENINEKIEIIVPDKLSLYMEKFLFESLGLESSFNIKVSTLNRFAKRNFVVDKELTISKLGSILLIHKIMNENINNLQAMKSKVYSFNYAEEIFNSIAQLKASKISWQEMEGFSSNDEQLNNKIGDLTLIYREYEFKKAGRLDASDMFLMSVFSVADGRDDTKLIFVGFDDFTAIEYSIIERLAKTCEVVIYNYNSSAKNKHIYNGEVIDQLKNIAYINELPYKQENIADDSGEFREFLHSNLFGLNKDVFTLYQDKIHLFKGNSIDREIEFVARDIREKILSGHKYNEFGVAIYGLDNVASKVKEIFQKYEINAYIDNEISLNKSVFYKFLVSIFKYNLESYNLSHLLDVINSPFFMLDRDDKNRLMNKLIDYNFMGKISKSTDLGEECQESLAKLLEFLDLYNIDKSMNIMDLVSLINNANEKLCIKDTLDSLSQDLDSQNKIILLKSYSVVNELISEIIKFENDISIESFVDIFTHIYSVVKINNLPLTIDSVKVVDADNQMEIFDNLYIVNCTVDTAPSLKADCGIILDSEIEKLHFSHKLAPTIAHINRLAKLRLYNLISLFEENLTITYSKSQSEAVTEIENKFKLRIGDEEIRLVPIVEFAVGQYKALSKWDSIEFWCKKDKNNKNIDKNNIVYKDFSTISQDNLQIYKDMNKISASRLENYFDCPFNSFLNHQLKIKPRISADIQSFDIGTILHDIVYLYYKRNKNVGEVYEFCKNHVQKYIESNQRLKLHIDSPIVNNLINEAVRTLRGVDYLDDNSKFEANRDMLEYDFTLNPLRLKNINIIGKVDRVDQFGDMMRIIDYKSGKANASLKELYYGHKLQLFLYSSAVENITGKKVVGCFYLPLHNDYTREIGNSYALNGFFINENNVIEAFDKRLIPGMKSDIVNVNMVSSGLARGTVGHKELKSQDMSKLINYAKAISETAVDDIRSGYIAPNPSGLSEPCNYCAYKQVCMRNSKGINYRAVESVGLDSFKEGEYGGV